MSLIPSITIITFFVLQAFVLQLEGKKKWKLYKPIEELSREHSDDLTADEIGVATHEIELEVRL